MSTTAQRLAGKVAIVTGASRGIGASIAKRLAAEGAKVAVNYVSNADAAKEVVSEIQSAGGQACAIRADISRTDAARHLTLAACTFS